MENVQALLRYPFPFATNSYAEKMEKTIKEWIADYYAFLPERAKKKYLQTGIGHAGGCMFPRASKAQLKAICRFYIWAFTIDDTFEFSNPTQIEDIRQKAQSILMGGKFGHDEELYSQLPVLRQELLGMGGEIFLQRFCNSLNIYFEGLKEEIPYRTTLKFPSFDEFVKIREKSVNVYPLVDIAQGITGKFLPSGVLEHPILRRLGQLTCLILSWSNDFFSAHLEKGNDVLNIVLMLQNIHQCSMADAYRASVQIHDQDVTTFCLLKDALPDFGIYTLAVKEYIENLSLMIAGYLHWTNVYTERYKKSGHPSKELKNGLTVNI